MIKLKVLRVMSNLRKSGNELVSELLYMNDGKGEGSKGDIVRQAQYYFHWFVTSRFVIVT